MSSFSQMNVYGKLFLGKNNLLLVITPNTFSDFVVSLQRISVLEFAAAFFLTGPANREIQTFTTMARYVPMDLLSSLKGKICSHSDVYFAEKNGTKYTGKICNHRTTPFSQTELDHQARFKAAHAAAIARMADTTKRATDEAAFKAQTKKKSLYGYITSLAYANAVKDTDSGTWSVTWPDASGD